MKTEQGRAQFEDALKQYAVLNTTGLRKHLTAQKMAGKESKVTAFIRPVQEVDQDGVISYRRYALIPLDTPAQERWVVTQLSARFELIEEDLVA